MPILASLGVGAIGAYRLFRGGGIAVAANYIEDYFSTYLYTGNTNNAQMVNNPIPLANGGANGTVLQMPCESISDVAPYPNTLTNGGASVNSSVFKFGSNSLYFDGASRVSITPAISNNFVFYGDFTVEGWVYPTGGSDLEAWFTLSSAGAWNNPSGLVISYARLHYGTTSNFGFSGITSNAWNHVAVVRSAGTISLYVNGTRQLNFAYSDVIGATGTTPALGVFDAGSGSGRFFWSGYIDDVRVTNGTAIYTGTSFTPPTSALVTTTKVTSDGGLVWVKRRTPSASHALADTVRGARNILRTNTTDASTSTVTEINGFYPSGGFSVGSGETTGTSYNYVSWTFRKQAKFFDVVSVTTNANGRLIFNHLLDSTPGCIIFKGTDQVQDWWVYHRSTGTNKRLYLNLSDAPQNTGSDWITVTSTSVTTAEGLLLANKPYIAYLFAHDAGGFGTSGTDNVISCGTFTYSAGTDVNLGYEPQWLLTKRTDAAGDWTLIDALRPWTADGISTYSIPNASSAEPNPAAGGAALTATGFRVPTGFGNGSPYLYIAIRRGPMKTPTSGTSVYQTDQVVGAATQTAGFPVDFVLEKQVAANNTWRLLDRLRGNGVTLYSDQKVAEGSENYWSFDNSTGVYFSFGGLTNRGWMFRRAPSLFDVVCYTGNGLANRTVSHNLGVVPELMIVKTRDGDQATGDWIVYHKDLPEENANKKYWLSLNTTAAAATSIYGGMFSGTSNQTTTTFKFTNDEGFLGYYYYNFSGIKYVSYLFASAPGVSKVGSYTGTGTTKQIDCGFTNGARFILIKRTDSTGDWYIWDTARGIVSGNDPYLLLNSSAAEVTNTDYIDTYSAGFEISSTAPAAINANGGTFIFLAIA